MKKIGRDCSCGLATGRVFCGIVGTANSRREYSIIGDKVELSQYLMQQAKKHSSKNKILCGPNIVK